MLFPYWCSAEPALVLSTSLRSCIIPKINYYFLRDFIAIYRALHKLVVLYRCIFLFYLLAIYWDVFDNIGILFWGLGRVWVGLGDMLSRTPYAKFCAELFVRNVNLSPIHI